MHPYKNLLDQVSAIDSRYKKINELTGENFNVFRILKLESSEVRMHSAFIAELLNPKGSHGQEDKFLKIFLELFWYKSGVFDTENCETKVELHTGFLNEDKSEGGRIDVFICDKNKNHLIIENKIYASDQFNQLVRYNKYSPEGNIIYLTLFGDEPSIESRGELEINNHFKCYSYHKDIIQWLELCRKEVAVLPIIREAITHYINLIKHLTNQTQNENMKNELIEVIESNFKSSWLIATNLDNACQKIAENFFDGLKISFEQDGFICTSDINFKARFSGIYLWKPDWKNLCIAFQFQRFDKNLIYGFLREEPETIELLKETKEKLNNLSDNTGSGSLYWPWYKIIENPYADWSLLEAWEDVLNGNMKNVIIEKAKWLLTSTQHIDFTT